MKIHRIMFWPLYANKKDFLLCDVIINSNITLSCENYITINYINIYEFTFSYKIYFNSIQNDKVTLSCENYITIDYINIY